MKKFLADKKIIVLIILFIIVFIAIQIPELQKVDNSLTLSINDAFNSEIITKIMQILTDYTIVFVIVGIIAGLAIHLKKDLIVLGVFISSIIGMYFVTSFFKIVFERPRPFDRLDGIKYMGAIAYRDYSFPSAHTSISFLLAIILIHIFKFNKLQSFAVYIVAFLIGFSRIYLGAHYFSDVIAGALIGTIVGMVAVKMLQKSNEYKITID